MINNQAYLFIIFTIDGILIGILFDFFRVLRRTFKTKDFVTYIQDILFWIITGIMILYSMYVFCDGELRFFMILGIIMGVAIYMFTLSKYIMKFAIFLLKILKKILIYPIKVIFKPIMIICINIKKNLCKFVEKIKKYRGFFIKKEKYNSM